MIEKISVLLNAHKETYDRATAIFQEQKAKILAEYKTQIAVQKLKEVKDIYDQEIFTSQQETFSGCNAVLDEVREKVKDIASRPVDANFPAVVAALKAMNNPSRAELYAITGAYKNNYVAYRAICDLVGGEAVTGKHVATVDEVLGVCDFLTGELHKAIFDNPTCYIFRLFLQGDFLAKRDEFFTAFVEGRFEDAMITDDQDGDN